MSEPTLEEIKRAAASEGAEPMFNQKWWRAAVRVLLAEREGHIALERSVNEACNQGDGSYRP